MPRFLKRGMDAERHQGGRREGARDRRGHPRRRSRQRGDAAVRELSEKFDKWSPANFKLTPQEIEQGDRPGRQARPRRHQVRAGAGARLRAEAARDHEGPRGRDAARRDPRPPPHPGELDRLLRAGRALSDGRLRAHVDRHRASRGREAHHRLRAAVPWRAASRDRRRDAFRRRGRDLRARRRAGGRHDGARHRHRSTPST